MSGGGIQMELGFGFGEWREGATGGRVLGFWGFFGTVWGLSFHVQIMHWEGSFGVIWGKTKLNVQ